MTLSASNKILYAGLVFAQILTFCAYVVVTAGAALLQERANHLPLWQGLNATQTAATESVYNDVFQSTTYIIPYAKKPYFQFQYEWWIIEFEFFIFLWTLTATIFPRLIRRIRPVCLTLLAAALVQVMDNINAIWFLLRDDTAQAVYERYRINTAQAGLLLVGIANGFTIIFMGLYDVREHDAPYPGPYAAPGKDVNGAPVGPAQV